MSPAEGEEDAPAKAAAKRSFQHGLHFSGFLSDEEGRQRQNRRIAPCACPRPQRPDRAGARGAARSSRGAEADLRQKTARPRMVKIKIAKSRRAHAAYAAGADFRRRRSMVAIRRAAARANRRVELAPVQTARYAFRAATRPAGRRGRQQACDAGDKAGRERVSAQASQ